MPVQNTMNMNYGDGTSEELVVVTINTQISHIYQTPGVYNVSAIITSSNSAGTSLITLGTRQVSVTSNVIGGNDTAADSGGGGSFGLWMISLLFFRLLVPGVRTA